MNTPSRADVLLHCGEMTKNELNAAMSALMWRQEFIESQQSTIDAQRAEIERLTKELETENDANETLARCLELITKERDDACAELYSIAEQIGVCGAGKCSADMWADPPRDCSAPDCLDIGKGIKQMKEKLKRFDGCVPVKWRQDGSFCECPCCKSLDIGGAVDTVHCYKCGLTVKAERPLQNAMDKWNTRNGILLTANEVSK